MASDRIEQSAALHGRAGNARRADLLILVPRLEAWREGLINDGRPAK
ncbi:MAG TPA: hypothetical protein VKM00_04230 [Luteimonas sp.]|nr:hypothetical protein [Luteimonas sp.]